MQPCILDGDRDLAGDRGEQRRLVGGERTSAGRVDGEQPDHVAVDDQRNRVRGVDPRLTQRCSDGREVTVVSRVR